MQETKKKCTLCFKRQRLKADLQAAELHEKSAEQVYASVSEKERAKYAMYNSKRTALKREELAEHLKTCPICKEQ